VWGIGLLWAWLAVTPGQAGGALHDETIQRFAPFTVPTAPLVLAPQHRLAPVSGAAAPALELEPVGERPTARLTSAPGAAPPGSWHAIWSHHRGYVLALAGALLTGLVLLVMLWLRTRRLKQQRESLRLAASVFCHTHEGIMILSPDGRIIEVNRAFSDITGYPRDEALGQSALDVASAQQDEAFFTALWNTLRTTGEWYGEIWSRHQSGRVYPLRLTVSAVHNERGELQRYVGLMTDITELKAHQQKLEDIAYFDALTGLPNRALLADRIKRAMALARRYRHRLGLVFIDLDGFKAVNDAYGHAMGDRLLIALSSRMAALLRESDTLGRLGGDEFVAVLGELSREEDCFTVLDRLLEEVARPVILDGVSFSVSASLGVAFYPAGQELDADQLLRQADQAMYQAKRQGKNRYACFDPREGVPTTLPGADAGSCAASRSPDIDERPAPNDAGSRAASR